MMLTVTASTPTVRVYSDATAWTSRLVPSLLAAGLARGIDFTEHVTTGIAQGIPEGTQVVWLGSNAGGHQLSIDNVNSAAAQAALDAFVQKGACL